MKQRYVIHIVICVYVWFYRNKFLSEYMILNKNEVPKIVNKVFVKYAQSHFN
jgi:hypothetical protein